MWYKRVKEYCKTYGWWLCSNLLLVWLFVLFYRSPFGELFLGSTRKNYFYDENRQVIFTAILFEGIFWNTESKINPRNGRRYPNDGMGLYLIPGRFTGRLPKENYIRMDYRGIESAPIYYKHTQDTLYFRIPYRRIIENKLPENVVLDTLDLDYERYGPYYKYGPYDTVQVMREYQEWEKMREEYDYFWKSDLE